MLCVFQYRVECSEDPSFPPNATTLSVTISSTWAVLSGLSPGIGYYIRVAVDASALLGYAGIDTGVLPNKQPPPYIWTSYPGCSCGDAAARLQCLSPLSSQQPPLPTHPRYPRISECTQ